MSSAMICVVVCSFVMIGLAAAQDDNLVAVMAPAGEIHGQLESFRYNNKEYTYTSFKGIPYGESTADERRFKKPEAKDMFTSAFKALEFGSVCPQDIPMEPPLPISEDCLNLNVLVPGKASEAVDLPVMIYIYGGGFQIGWSDPHHSHVFAATNNVILVTFNYRLGPFGFLSNEEELRGNYGLWDQHLAIKWVNTNIGKFGGDTSRVTLFGQSAGAASVIYQALFPGNMGKFQNIIAQSGSALSPWASDPHPGHKYNDLAMRAGCGEHNYWDDIYDCLRQMSIEDSFKFVRETHAYFLPSVDGEFVTMKPHELLEGEMTKAIESMEFFRSLNVVQGVNLYDGMEWNPDKYQLENGLSVDEFNSRLYEGTSPFFKLDHKMWDLFETTTQHQYGNWNSSDVWNPYTLRQGMADLFTDYYYIAGMAKVAMAHVNAGGSGKMFMYQFQHKPSVSPTASWIKGAIHSDELPFVFGLPWMLMAMLGWKADYFEDPTLVVPPKELMLSQNMMEMWTHFAKNGQPSPDKEWPEYTDTTQQYIVFNSEDKPYPVHSHMRASYVNFWNEVVHELLKVNEGYGCSSGGWEPGVDVSAGTSHVTSAGSVALVVSLLVLLRDMV